MGNLLIIFGIVLVALGFWVNLLPRLHLPLLPGDIFIQRENFTFYFPIVTSIIISVILTILINLIRK